MTKSIIALLMMGIGFGCPVFAQVIDSPQVKTTNGVIQGVVMPGGIHSFKGIPYAQPPVGDLRWKEPQSPKNHTGILYTDHFGPQAMQEYVFNDMMFRSNGKSEDCLYLNVWTPADAKGKALPVLVYFYGGGFRAGDGSEYRYDGESMAKRGIIAITINYRLGIFGFMSHPELTKESPHHSSGNYGLMDQHAALVWVQKNIAAFGGDPNKVTIAGESAGSMSVAAQVTTPLSKGLFRGAIAESGSDLGNDLPKPLADGEQAGLKFAAKVGASSLADLRRIPADSLLKLSDGTHFPVVIDGYFFPESPLAIFIAGKQMQVPLLAGWNSAEVDYHSVLGDDSATVANYKKDVAKHAGDHTTEILNAYLANTNADVKQVATDLAADQFIVYATWKFIDMQSKTGTKPVYSYIFSQIRQNKAGRSNEMGAAHSSEIEYALGNLATNPVYNWSADDYKVSEEMQSYFANFIKTGNPNGTGLPQWPDFKTSGQRLKIDINTIAVPQKNRDRYKVMDDIYKP
jgi:para-nitrobenzyl esterase